MPAAEMVSRQGRNAVRIRQLADQLRHRLSFVPGLYVLAALLLVQVLLLLDRQIEGGPFPEFLATTAPSARSVFQVIAGGLITAITLVLSMMLITVQLASSQMSPRTLRNWIGDRIVQHTIGLALGTTTMALLALRSTRSVGEPRGAVVPNLTLSVTVVAAIVVLFMLVGSVDHIANSVRIGAVAERIVADTASTIEESDVPEAPTDGRDRAPVEGVARGAVAVVSPSSGWVQQVDVPAILAALPEQSRAVVAVRIGSFAHRSTPLLWVERNEAVNRLDHDELCRGFALGDTRTLQQDVSFGLVQLSDIAVRALSPGVNDPGTAEELIAHLGDLLLRLWERPSTPWEHADGTRTVVFRRPTHADHLETAFGAIRRYGAHDPLVMVALAEALAGLRSEVERRDLPGPVRPIEAMQATLADTVDPESWSDSERARFDRAVATPEQP